MFIKEYVMQILKDHIKDDILNVARKHFRDKGFIKTSMRDIAKEVQIGVGNIYNYYPNKDNLFCCIVRPVIHLLEAQLQAHHGKNGQDIMRHNDDTKIAELCSDMTNIILNNKELLYILFFRAQGSSLENYCESFTDKATVIVKQWFADNKRKYPQINSDISDFSIHIHTVWQFSMMQELVMHDIGEEEMKKVIQEYIIFETKGWKELIGI